MKFLNRHRKTQKEQFFTEGYVNLGKVFDDEEVAIMKSAVDSCPEMQSHAASVRRQCEDGKYPSFKTIFVMNDTFTDNMFSLACRKPEIIDFISNVFDEDAYLYHSKVTLKYPEMPGFKYHQDYFYWYRMGCLLPKMATCFIALEEAAPDNGCLKFVPKSHLCGRIEHFEYDGVSDSEADPERVSALIDRFGEAEMSLKPGEVTVHHGNLLHGSEQNSSSRSRIALLGCFNTRFNNPVRNDSSHPAYGYQPRFKGKITNELRNALPDFSVSFKDQAV